MWITFLPSPLTCLPACLIYWRYDSKCTVCANQGYLAQRTCLTVCNALRAFMISYKWYKLLRNGCVCYCAIRWPFKLRALKMQFVAWINSGKAVFPLVHLEYRKSHLVVFVRAACPSGWGVGLMLLKKKQFDPRCHRDVSIFRKEMSPLVFTSQ